MTVAELIAKLQTLPATHTVTAVNEDGEYVALTPDMVKAQVDMDRPHDPPPGPEWYLNDDGEMQRDVVNLIDLSYDPPR